MPSIQISSLVLRSPIFKLRCGKPTMIIIIGLIEILGDLFSTAVASEIVTVTVRYHVLGKFLTTRIARHKLLSFVVH